jgi:hypothetical protein
MNVGKATDGMLDQILTLTKNRDATLMWLSTMAEAKTIDREQAEWLMTVLRGEDIEDE